MSRLFFAMFLGIAMGATGMHLVIHPSSLTTPWSLDFVVLLSMVMLGEMTAIVGGIMIVNRVMLRFMPDLQRKISQAYWKEKWKPREAIIRE